MSGDLSIGAVGAALIAGVVSLLGLIISKEQKTSEFRQTWVDSLRSEITNYLTSFNSIADALLVEYHDQNVKVAALGPLYSKFNNSGYAITLRLNPDEDRSKAVLSCMKRFNQLAANEADMKPINIKPIEIDFLAASKELLKFEWTRVKRGEPTFRATKIIAAFVIVATFLTIPWIVKPSNSSKSNLTSEETPLVINNVRGAVTHSAPNTAFCPKTSAPPRRDKKGVHSNVSNASAQQRRSRRHHSTSCVSTEAFVDPTQRTADFSYQ